MKIEHINKLILKFIGGGIVNFPTRFLKWIKVESCGCNGGGGDDGGSDDEGDDSGDSQDCITLEDFTTFYISVIEDDYVGNREADETLQLSDFFETSNINILKGLLTLGTIGESTPDSSIYFTEHKVDLDNAEGWYSHSITIYPNGGESGNIQVSTNHTYLDDGVSRTDNYDIGFWYYGGDTLTVSYVNSYGE